MTSTLSQSSLVTKMTRVSEWQKLWKRHTVFLWDFLVTPSPFQIERHLYLGSLEAATDVILLESHGITHIVSVDSVPLPRKMTSMLPRIALLHLQVSQFSALLAVCFGVILSGTWVRFFWPRTNQPFLKSIHQKLSAFNMYLLKARFHSSRQLQCSN